MKKLGVTLISVLLCSMLFVGCAPAATVPEATATPAATAEATATPEATAEPASEEPAATAAEAVTLRLGGLTGPTSMGMVKLLDDANAGLSNVDVDFTLAGSADELTPKFLQGELDVLAAPLNLGAVLYNNSEGGVQLAAVNTLGVIYIVEKGGEEISSLADLKGATILATGKGSTPEYALSYLLVQAGLTLGEDVTVDWKSEPAEVVAAMAQMDHAVAMLPQPFVTVAQTQLEGLRVALDLTKEWDALKNGSQLVTAGLFVRKAFAEEHPEALAAFLEEYAASTAYVNANVEEAAALIESFNIVKAAIAQKALPYCNIVCITGADMKAAVAGYLQVLYEQNPKAVGGTLPADDFYLGAA